MESSRLITEQDYRTIVVATESDEVSRIAWEAAKKTSSRQIRARHINEAHMALLRGCQIAVLELSMITPGPKEILKVSGVLRPPVTLILIAKDEQEALDSGIDICGSVFHIFLACPPVEYLKDILLAALRKQEAYQHKWQEFDIDREGLS